MTLQFFLNINAYNKLGSLALKYYSSMLTAFDKSKINPLGYFEVPIKIEDEIHYECMYCWQYFYVIDAFLGADILMQGEVHINKDVFICKFNVVQNTDGHINNICVTDSSEFNIGSHISKHIQEITNYLPIEMKSTDVELYIQLIYRSYSYISQI